MTINLKKLILDLMADYPAASLEVMYTKQHAVSAIKSALADDVIDKQEYEELMAYIQNVMFAN